MKKAFFALSFCYIFTLFGEKPPLIIGTSTGYAPFVSLNNQGNYEGFDIDIAHLIAEKMDRTLQIQDLGTLPSLFLGLEQKKVDLVIWAVSITEERSKKMQMIYYQGEKEINIPILFWKTPPEGLCSLEDLSKNPKNKICVEAGSWQASVIEHLPNIKQVDNLSNALLELEYGKSYAIVVDPSLVPTLLSKNSNLTSISLPLPPDKQSLGNGICIAKANSNLGKQIEDIINNLISEGKILELEKKWGLKKINE
jgi:ABC-type amino acid transport substrate-binding protein